VPQVVQPHMLEPVSLEQTVEAPVDVAWLELLAVAGGEDVGVRERDDAGRHLARAMRRKSLAGELG